MDCKSEESAQRAESLVLQGQEGIPGDGGEDGLSEIFQLLQMDVEYEHQEDGACPANSATWCSVCTCPQHSKRFLKALTKEKLLEAKHSGPRLCVDLSMTHQMSKKELSRLAGQIRRLYGSNKKASRPFWICLTGFPTDSPLYEECLRMNDGFSAYLLDVTEEDCFSLFPLETLVYLTPDSEQALEDIDQNMVYIIGGLVDESIQKKVTLQKAREYSVKTARLPIQEYMVRRQNKKNYHSEILAINQVFDILSTYFETHNWPEALKKGVSPGKGYILRDSME
ncbi:RNA (guanine-9-)-methyltransferase domain-containing protein 3 [Cricetulus griseus]|nr:RNA (guanine-9-)-methyltransferase domain-containing protein 3 [Cricetulus griseus]